MELLAEIRNKVCGSVLVSLAGIGFKCIRVREVSLSHKTCGWPSQQTCKFFLRSV